MARKTFSIQLSALALATGLLTCASPALAQETSHNPHDREACIDCHGIGKTAEGNTRIIILKDEDPHSVISHSCRTCHKEGKENFWILVLPQGRSAAPAAGASPPPAAPPQLTGGAAEGFANSHDSLECTKCHEKTPGSVLGRLPEPFPFGAKGVGGFCRGCHPKADQTHFPRGNRPRQGIHCLSCHQAHGSTLLFPSLRDDYPALLIESRELNPHGGKIFCLSCHRDSPQGGQAVNFRDDDHTALCRRCHPGAEHHPLGVKSNRGTWKMDFSDLPLQAEQITCVTCHDPYECESVVTRDNPRFLRGGPYNTVEDFCQRCHEGTSFASLNPHDQIDDEGNVRKKQCLYCHAVSPEEGVSLGPQDFTDDLQSLCASCHPVPPHPDVNHLVELRPDMLADVKAYEEKRLVLLPLVGDAFVTCVTCHNPHERGLLRGPAGIGADEDKRLRLATFNEICTPCHGRH